MSLIPVVHHNVLQQHAMLSKGYTLDNAADLKALFNQYGIQFGFQAILILRILLRKTWDKLTILKWSMEHFLFIQLLSVN